MSITINPTTVLLREPNLLIPGRKPVGPVKVDWTHPNTNGLLHWWPMLEGAGAVIRDYGMGKLNGAFVNSPEWLVPHPSTPTGIHLTKADTDYISIPGFITPHKGTIMFWVLSISDITFRPIGSHDAYECRFNASNHRIENQFFAASSHILISVGEWAANQWVHIVFTYDYVTAASEIYIDGIFDTSDIRANDDPGDGTLEIGKRPGNSEYLDGYIDDVMIYNRVLTAREIHSIYSDEYAALIAA